MNRRPLLSVLFAALLLAKFLHCATEAATGIGQIAEYHTAVLALPNTAPLHLPPPVCDHEFGCLCRGAIVASIVPADAFRPDVSGTTLPEPLSVTQNASPIMDEFSSPIRETPPLTALELRALLASFLI